MSDVTIESAESIAAYSGEHAIPGIRFRPAARALGVSAWGMNLLEIDPGCDAYPEHDHTHDGQEEVYVVLRGGGTLIAGGAEHALREGQLARVSPGVTRKILPGPAGIVFLAIGATPGKVFESSLG